MNDDLLPYYERELTFLREMGREFADKYPKIAGRLLLEADKCADPHAERMIEAFAFLAARIHRKIDDHFPEITESLLSILYPHYISPIPAAAIVRFDPVAEAVPPEGFMVPADTQLFSRPVDGTACQFTTVCPVTLYPLTVTSAGVRDPRNGVRRAQQMVSIGLRTTGGIPVARLGCNRLRFFINAPDQYAFHLYELLCNNVCRVEVELTGRQGERVVVPLPDDAVVPAGFEVAEGLLPPEGRSFSGYRLLFEYFCFPEKFLLFDVAGFDRLGNVGSGDSAELCIYLDRPARSNVLVTGETFALFATPAVNLFRRLAEPIRVEMDRTEYAVIPDLRRREAMEVFSVDDVASSPSRAAGEVTLKPLYSLRHHMGEEVAGRSDRQVFWHQKRLPSGRKGDDGTDVYLTFTDRRLHPAEPGFDTVHAWVTCTNRDLPLRIPAGGEFHTETAAPVKEIRCLRKPSPTRRPSLGGELQWRLISHLSLNYLSLVEGGEHALKEILKLYDFDDSPATRQQIDGIVSVRSDYVTKRIGQSFCRGMQVMIDFDEDKFVGGGAYLFASVLERFLGEYVSVNSFSQLVATTIQRKEILRKWAPRSGSRVLL